MSDHANILKAFIVPYKQYEYLCAECDHGYVGIDYTVYAKRKIGNVEWENIGIFDHDPKQPCATLFVFGANNYDYLKTQKEFPKDELLKIIDSLGIP